MTDVTELKCWPSCVDAIDWSQDGIIALASDECVELLFPNTVSFDRDQHDPQWQHVPLKVPLFSYEELPVKEPAPLEIYSIGEEVSSSVPVAIAWSPSGLAKHRRCALATLTANLVLSIWSAESQPQEESSWSRCLIINNALAEYFLNNAIDESSHHASGIKEKMRLRSRIRSFCWAPAFPSSTSNGIIGTRLSYGQHIVAVSNDDNQVALLAIYSPTSTLGVNQSWSAEVLTHFSLPPDPESILPQPLLFEDVMKQQRHISHVAWSPWVIRGDWYHSVIVYATNEDVRARIVTYTHDSIGLGDEIVYPGIELRYNGLMKWSPRVEDGINLKLALFKNSGLVYLIISAHDASIINQVTHNLDGRWDQLSGAVWDSTQGPTLRLHFSSLLSTLQNPTAVLEASDGLKSLTSPNWRDQIENNLVLFSVKNDLKGNSKAKVWGLTTSPLGDFIAASNSIHPSDMIEYGPPADRRGTIAISTLRQYGQIRKAFPARNVSAEGMLFTLKKLAENTVEDADQVPAFAEEMVEKLMQAYSPSRASKDDKNISAKYPDSNNLNELIESFKKVAFLEPNTLKDRYTILVSQASNATPCNDLSKTLIAYRLAIALLDLPSSLTQTSFSAEILAQHRQLISLINSLTEPYTLEAEPSTNQVHTLGQDTCYFCTAPIPFADLTSATCTNEHQFPRCGLTFLPIQAPGITKYCGLCSMPFLSEEFVVAQEAGSRGKNIEKERITVAMEDAVPGRGGQDPGEREVRLPGRVKDTDDVDVGNGTVATAEKAEQYTRNHDEQPEGTQHVQEQAGIASDVFGEVERRELPVTLARVLFLACDVCIYCGGKFVG
ncbi:Nn.00g110640.m01.CDS01 [Neocucurbitaria sp. VM-36]